MNSLVLVCINTTLILKSGLEKRSVKYNPICFGWRKRGRRLSHVVTSSIIHFCQKKKWAEFFPGHIVMILVIFSSSKRQQVKIITMIYSDKIEKYLKCFKVGFFYYISGRYNMIRPDLEACCASCQLLRPKIQNLNNRVLLVKKIF